MKNKGFTLLELMIVIAIMGLLLAAGLPKLKSFNLSFPETTTGTVIRNN